MKTDGHTLPLKPPVVYPFDGDVQNGRGVAISRRGDSRTAGRVGMAGRVLPPAPIGGHDSLGISVHISPKSGVVFYPKGIQTVACKQVMGKGGGTVFERGKVTSFSAHSRGRLRRVLMSWAPPEGWRLGAGNFTLPGPVVEGDVWRKAFNPWCLFVAKKGACAIWRIELQTRKQPHAHATVWGPTKESVEDIFGYWRDCVKLLGPVTIPTLITPDVGKPWVKDWTLETRMNMPGASDHALVWSWSRDDMAGWWRYLCDHTSKKKAAQLGWKGRQWGVVGRVHFQKLRGDFQQLSDAEFARVLRVLRRLSRPVDPMKRKFWRYGKLRGKRGCSDWFSSPETLRRVVEWARSESVNQQGEK